VRILTPFLTPSPRPGGETLPPHEPGNIEHPMKGKPSPPHEPRSADLRVCGFTEPPGSVSPTVQGCKARSLRGNLTPKTGVGEHARPGRRWIRPRIQPWGVRMVRETWNCSVRSRFSARARKTAPGAGALPMAIPLFGFNGCGRCGFTPRPRPRWLQRTATGRKK